MGCYSVTMVITKFVQAECDRAVQEELFDIKFIDFGVGLMFFYRIHKHVKMHTFSMGITECSFLQC